MIISASRRTDIPAFFGEWFMNRLRTQKVMVRNPMNQKTITELSLDPHHTECIVFWTKNPANFLQYIPEIDDLGHRYYFQFTLTPYDPRIEKNIDKSDMVDIFIKLSEQVGKERVIWRYDPIILNSDYILEYHLLHFETLCKQLHRYTERCVLSFVDIYVFLVNDFRDHAITELSGEQVDILAGGLSDIAHKYHLPLASCSEKINLEKHGITHNKCIDAEMIEKLFGITVNYKKDPSQRAECGCCVSRDIGSYNTCLHGCVYCYARRGKKQLKYDPESVLLCDAIDGTEKITRL